MGRKLKPEEYIGKRYWYLTVLSFEGMRNGRHSYWECICDCGNTTITEGSRLRSGMCKSCGKCKSVNNGMRRVNRYDSKYDYHTRLYKEWAKMKYRAHSRKWYNAHRYVKKGITVCDEWLEYEPFMEWALSNGYEDNLTLDRIDNSRGYSPDNCRWADRKTQTRNRDITLKIEYKGEIRPLAEWAEILGVKYRTLYGRINTLKWSVEEAFEKPLRNR